MATGVFCGVYLLIRLRRTSPNCGGQGQGFNSPPLGAIMNIPRDIPLLAAGQFIGSRAFDSDIT